MSFYGFMSAAVAAIVVFGFSQTIDAGLIHPAEPLPPILYVHAAVFGAWVILLMTQATLIGAGNVRLHRKVGAAGFVLGSAMPVVGTATAIAMARFYVALEGVPQTRLLVLSLFDMLAFSVPFGLAMLWRRHAEFHRRLMLIASCTLTVAAFNRFPTSLLPPDSGFFGVDALILIGAGRDLIATRRVHPTYLCGLPAIVLGQLISTYLTA
jgi:uncharacterized membrane protein YozB (DUF420 family)